MKLRWLTITLAALGVFAPASLWAFAEKCGPLFTSEYAELGRIEILPSGSNGPKGHEYTETIQKVNSLLGDLLIPHETTVVVDGAFIFSTFNPETYGISVGIRHPDMGVKHPRINLNTLTHEYGHAIFEKNMDHSSALYAQLRETMMTIHQTEQVLDTKISSLKKHLDSEKDAAIKENLQSEISYLKNEQYKLEVLREKNMNHWNIRAAVHELFADIVAVTTSKNPQALRSTLESIEYRHKEHSSLLLNLRDFADGRHHKNRQQWNKDHARIVQNEGDIYYAFLPARWEFWQIVKGRLDATQLQKEVLPKVFVILQRHLDAELAKSAAEIRPSGFKNIEALNNKIIQDFRNEL